PTVDRLRRLLSDGVDIDADRERRGAQPPPEGGDLARGHHLSAGVARDVIAKAAEVGFRLESDEIVGAERAHQLGMWRQDAQQLCGGEGGVEEKSDRLLDAELAQRRAQRDQMIIVYPDDVARLEQRGEVAGELLVDAEIAREIGALKIDEAGAVMEERPQHA